MGGKNFVLNDLFGYNCHSDYVLDENRHNLSNLNERLIYLSTLNCCFGQMDDMASVRFDRVQSHHHLNYEKQKCNRNEEKRNATRDHFDAGSHNDHGKVHDLEVLAMGCSKLDAAVQERKLLMVSHVVDLYQMSRKLLYEVLY